MLLVLAVMFFTTSAVAGETWTPINNAFPSATVGAVALAMDPTTPSTLYSWNDKAMLKSTDGAASWTTTIGTSEVRSLVIDPTNSSNIYALTRNGVVKSTNGGTSWAGANAGLPAGYITSLAMDPFTPSSLYASIAYGTLFKSTDGAESWNALDTELPRGSLGVLVFDPVRSATIYAVGVNGGIFRSTNGAESWTAVKAPVNIAFGETVLSLAIDPTNPSTIFAGSFAAATGGPGGIGHGSIGKSTNGGQSWNRISVGIPSDAFVRSLSIDPESPWIIYGTYVADGSWGIIKSIDHGESWRVINNGLPSGRFNGSRVLIDPTAPATLYAGYLDFSTGIGGVLKSVDYGETWTPANAGRKMIDTTVLTVDPVDKATLYTAAGTEGLFKSVDGGAIWSKLMDPWPGQYIRSLVVDFLNKNSLYALVERTNGCFNIDDVLFKSTDQGSSWEVAGPRRNGCDFYPSSYFVMDPTDPHTWYIGGGWNFEGALAKTNNDGASWTYLPLLPGDATVRTLVIDRTNPTTLYGGSWASLFKSIDGGTTWIEIGPGLGVNKLAIDPANSSVIYAATQTSSLTESGFGGLFKSADGGATWRAINNGLSDLMNTQSPITALVIDPADSNIVYAGTAGYGVFRSSDSGATWTQFNEGLASFNIKFLTVSPDTLYAGTSAGLFAVRIAPESNE